MSSLLSIITAYFVRSKKNRSWSRCFGVCLALIVLPASVSLAEFTVTGDVDPADPATWTNRTYGYIGKTADGSLIVDTGSNLISCSAYLGDSSDSTGEVTVDGASSTWINSYYYYIGNFGNGNLYVLNGGTVRNASGCAYLGNFFGSTGMVTVDGAGSTWMINNGDLYIGKAGRGTLNISNGGVVNNVDEYGYIGYQSGSTGEVTVDGTGSTWTNSEDIAVGKTGSGTLTISNGGLVSNTTGTIGLDLGSTGEVTVDGDGSTWTNGYELIIGDSGNGRLNITNGGAVSVSYTTWVAKSSGSTGIIDFGANGGTLTTRTLYGSPTQLMGTGTINTRGLVSDVDLVFDATNGSNHTFTLNNLGQDITVNLDLSDTTGMPDVLGIGYQDSGSMLIRDGVAVTSRVGYVGYGAASIGLVRVEGADSSWSNSLNLSVGNAGYGMLIVANGGAVNNTYGTIGNESGSIGEVMLDGTGSIWSNSKNLTVGYEGSGRLNILNGATVSVAETTYIAKKSGSTGGINFGANGGTLTTRTFYGSPTQLTGTGTIDTCGLVSDVDLVFDATHGLSQTLALTNPGQNITVNFDLSGADSTPTDLGIGYMDSGSMTIRDGISLASRLGYIGSKSGSTGVATVDGLGSTWTNSNDLYVGDAGSGTLNIINGGAVSNTLGHVGSETGSTGAIMVDGTDSTWTNQGDLSIGNYGSGTLNILNGGTVSSYVSCIGWEAGSTGDVMVDGNGSTWTCGTIYVGGSGSGRLSITDGGAVTSSYLGYIGRSSGSTSEVMVDDVGSIWNNSSTLYSGYYGSGTLNIINGGAVSNTYGSIGHYFGSMGEVTVDGVGSIWTNSNNLAVSYEGNGILNITNGGTVSNATGYVGWKSGSTGVVTVDGVASTWTNDGDLIIGDEGSGTLNITNGGAVSVTGTTWIAKSSGSTGTIDFGTNVGTLTTESLYVSPEQLTGTGTINTRGLVSDVDLIFDATHGVSQTLTLNNPGQNISVNLDLSGYGGTTTDLGVGYRSSGSMVIRDGIVVTSPVGYVGYGDGSAGVVTVNGDGSTWGNSGNLYVGKSGSGMLNIADSGVVSSFTGYVGSEFGSTGEVTVDGIGSTWTNSGYNFYVGDAGSGTLNITNGGVVNGLSCTIGSQAGSMGEVTVDGVGSTWTNSNYLYVGNVGSGTLNITNGGVVNSLSCIIRSQSGSVSEVTVDGVGSIWTNSNSLYIGNQGIGTLNISNGGAVNNNYGVIGYQSGSIGEVTVDGFGSTWTNSGPLAVGYFSYGIGSASGSLTISNGGAVSNTCGIIGSATGTTGEVTVDGTGSTWTNDGDLTVGSSGNGALNILNGGAVSVTGTTWIAKSSGSTGTIDFGANGGTLTTQSLIVSPIQMIGIGTINTRGLVSDVDLVFDAIHGVSPTFTINNTGQDITVNLDLSDSGGATNDLGIGYQDSGSMTIRDGITLTSQVGYVGYKNGSTGAVIVGGPCSTWINKSYLYVGDAGSGKLTITNAGGVRSASGYVGCKSGSIGEVTVDGAGSSWTESYYLYVGHSGNGTMNILNGGAVSNIDGYIGTESGSMGEVMVDGSVSSWTSSSRLFVGYEGNGVLNILNGGVVSNIYGIIGHWDGSAGEVTVADVGSTWTNSNYLYVGNSGSGRLNISDGGLVSVEKTLYIDYDNDGDSFIDMGTGGMLALAGDADDSLTDFMDLIVGSDAIRYWNESALLWENITTATADVDYTLSYLNDGELAGYTMLTVLTDIPLLGDANLDDVVDVGDLGVLASNYGNTGDLTWAQGDFNFDGVVDVGDLGILASNYGLDSVASHVSSQMFVPEPATLGLLAIVGLGWVSRRRF